MLTNEMKNYLVRGMREEVEKDFDGANNYEVRWHTGMYHETTKLVSEYQLAKKYANEERVTELEGILVSCYENWWKNYFDVSPEYAREQLRKKAELDAQIRQLQKYRDELNTIEAFSKEEF